MTAPSKPESLYELECPMCEARLQCRERNLGGRVRCSQCHHEFKAPPLMSIPEPPPIASEEPKRQPINRGPGPAASTPPPLSAFPGIGTSQPTARPTGRTRQRGGAITPTKLSRQSVVGLAACGVYGLLVMSMLVDVVRRYSTESNLEFRPLDLLALVVAMPLVGTLMVAKYLMPTMVAYLRDHKNAVPIGIINATFGWTFIGWIGTAARSFSSDVAESRQTVRYIIAREGVSPGLGWPASFIDDPQPIPRRCASLWSRSQAPNYMLIGEISMLKLVDLVQADHLLEPDPRRIFT